MYRSAILATSLLMSCLATSSGFTSERTSPLQIFDDTSEQFRIVPPAALPAPAIKLAQTDDATYRINELQDEVRRLNGKVEELTFQLLQQQEEMRKMQEDIELRFQELEDRQSDASDVLKDDSGRAEFAATTSLGGDQSLGKPEASGTSPDVKPTTSNTTPNDTALGEKPRTLGTLTFDANGNVVDRNRTSDADGGKIAALPLPGVFSDGVEGGVAAAEFGPTPAAVFGAGKTAIERKNYARGEKAFNAFLKAWPIDPRTAEARFHLGESLFWMGEYFKAANVYLDTHNAHPNAKTAADNLLGLGLSLAGLNQREVACATYGEVLKQYPEAASRLGAQVAAEQASAKC